MTEAGGSTAQSGILYQNSVTALYLGRLLDLSDRPDKERVEQVRAEAPTDVDDTVVTFADKHRTYIQSKEYLKSTSSEWKTLWGHFDEQFRRLEFQRGQDRLLLQIGFGLHDHYELQGICERATTYLIADEWQSRLSQEQKAILNRITPYLSPTDLAEEYVREFFAHIDINVLDRDAIEKDRFRDWIPSTNRTQKELFRLLRDRVGGEARVKGIFTAYSLRKDLLVESPDLRFDEPVDISTIRNSVQQCGSLLRSHQNKISGTDNHIEREVTNKIVEWVMDDTVIEKNVSMLLDQAGMGKTVVMRDVLLEIEDRKIDVLAIKADQQLSEIKDFSLDEIQKRLGLPYSVEKIVSRLAKINRMVILIDQIDALSLSLAHDQLSINVTLDLVARLRRIPNVRILLSCRVFDWNTDPRLGTIETGQTFSIPKLSEVEVKKTLDALKVSYDQLTSATKELLSIPLHLDLFARALTTNEVEFLQLRGIRSLQELYELIWQHVVIRQDTSGPLASERIEVINRLIEFMDDRQCISAPQSLLQTAETKHLERAVNWLASMGILIRVKTDWNFLHQTFFDYCYARRFVESGNDITAIVLSSKQGIFERPKLIQIIAYLRSFDQPRYISALKNLLYANNLRFHLYDLLLSWFGALSNPTDDEWYIAQKMFRDDLKFHQLLSAMYGNPDWLKRLQPSISRWFEDKSRDTIVLDYLRSLIDIAQSEVVALLEPFLGRSDEWDNLIANTIFHVRNWHTDSAVSLFEKTIYQLKMPLQWNLFQLEDVCDISPVAGCRIIGHLFDQALNNHLNELPQPEKDRTPLQAHLSFFLDTELKNLEGTIEKAMELTSSKAPIQYVEIMLPWIEKVISLQPHHDDMPQFTSDVFSSNWYDNAFNIQHAFLHSLIGALTQLAKIDPKIFRPIAQRLARLPYKTPQRLLCQVFRVVPDLYAEDAFKFLLGDQRRFDLGENQYDSYQAIQAIFPYLSNNQRERIEETILQYFPPNINLNGLGKELRKEFGLNALRWSGIEQYRLLSSIPANFLSLKGQKRFREWQHKFPEYVISDEPFIPQGGLVPSPIPSVQAKKMSNQNWLRAMGKYGPGIERHRFLGGGARQLSGVLLEEIKNDPDRFHKLFEVVPLDIDDSYVMAFANGFVESNALAEWTFEVFRRYASQERRNVQRGLAYSIQKLAKHSIPDYITKKLYEWIYLPETENESWWAQGDTHGSIYESYLNSERGAAFGTLFRIFDAKHPEDTQDDEWRLIEYASSDSSTALRLGAIEELASMIYHDRDKSWMLFEKLIDNHEILLETHQVRKFLHLSMYKNFLRLKPFVEQMIKSQKPETQEMGAELACIAAISENSMESDQALIAAKALAAEVITGQPPLRRGAVSVYTFNMTQGLEQNVRALCLENIRKLVSDDDEKIRNKINQKFFSLSGEFFFEFRSLMEDIAQAENYLLNLRFADYLWKHGMQDPEWTLSIIRILVSKTAQPQQWESGADELMRFALNVYTSQAIDDTVREEAMNIFDLLMKKYAGTANKILLELDRR